MIISWKSVENVSRPPIRCFNTLEAIKITTPLITSPKKQSKYWIDLKKKFKDIMFYLVHIETKEHRVYVSFMRSNKINIWAIYHRLILQLSVYTSWLLLDRPYFDKYDTNEFVLDIKGGIKKCLKDA